jgi:hypothetical protein
MLPPPMNAKVRSVALSSEDDANRHNRDSRPFLVASKLSAAVDISVPKLKVSKVEVRAEIADGRVRVGVAGIKKFALQQNR